MVDAPADLISGIAAGGAVVGACAVRVFDKVIGKGGGGREPSGVERLITELITATRANGETLRHLRDITAEMRGDHRVLELKMDQLSAQEKKS